MNKDLKKVSANELSNMYGNAMENSIQRNATEGEFKRRELFWIRFTAIVAIVSLLIMGVTAVGSFALDYYSVMTTKDVIAPK